MTDRRGLCIAGLVLAAGRSERMGRPKALCKLGGETLLHIALRNLDHPEVKPRIVVVRDRGSEVAVLCPTAALIAVNPEPELGPAASVRAALQLLPEDVDGFLVLPVDCPLVRPEDVAALIDAMRREDDPAIRIWIPSWQMRRGHPPLFAADLAAEIDALAPGEPLHRIVRADPRRVRHVAAGHEGVLLDVDSPEDLAAAQARLGPSR